MKLTGISKLKSGAFTLEFKWKLPQNAGKRKKTAINTKSGDKSGDKSVINEESSEKIIELIKNDPNISAAAIAEQIGVSSRAVEKQLKKLRDENLIRRVGPDKGGHWEIVKSD